MATYTRFNAFLEAAFEGKHDLSTHQISVALTTSGANAPSTTGDSVLADLVTVSTANFDTINVTAGTSTQTGGTYTFTLTDTTLTATGGSVGPFRFVVLYNNGATADDLIAFFDYGSTITVLQNETFTLDFGANLFTVTP